MFARQVINRLFCTEIRRNALRVEGQGKTWNHLELDRHANAFSLGMQELGLKPGIWGITQGDKIVTWLDPKHGLETITIQCGCMRCGITLHPVFGDSPDDFFAEISNSGAKAAIISPNRRVDGNDKQSEVLLKQIGELTNRKASLLDHTGSPLKLGNYPQLKFLIQTGFYNIPGVYKFRVA
jgi:acyl-CoA synthetase (AMP-forming)/AMP-acid ligase II